MNKFATIAALSVATVFALPISGALAVDEHYINDAAVVSGYDVVAYHTAGKPTKGSIGYGRITGCPLITKRQSQDANRLDATAPSCWRALRTR